MKFRSLQDNLRQTLSERIDAGELTGLALAAHAGFRQAHISNFLNRKRSLSLDAMDKVLSAEHLSVLDLLDPAEVNRRASTLPSARDGFEHVRLVDGGIAARSRSLITRMHVKEILKFKRSFLHSLRPAMETARHRWERFVALKMDGREGMSMYPRLLPGAVVLIDRHYNSLKPYHKGEANMYAVNKHGACTIRYVEPMAAQLILRPHNHTYPVDVLPLGAGKKAGNYIIGRICYVGMET